MPDDNPGQTAVFGDNPDISDERWGEMMADAEQTAYGFIADWMRAVCDAHQHALHVSCYLGPFVVAAGKSAAVASGANVHIGTKAIPAGLVEDCLVAYFRMGLRGTKEPVNQDGTTWEAPRGQA